MSLQFNDTSSAKNGLVQECESLIFGDSGYGRISGDANLLATFTRYINSGLNRVTSLILQADGRWEWDDNNNTDYPIATASLVADQKDYQLAVSHLKIIRVEVKDEDGNWHLINPIDQADVYDQSLTDFLKTAGSPLYYDKVADSLFLYPSPDYSQAASLKLYFQRPPSYFETTDTDKVPGFNSLYHRLVALIASRDYALMKTLGSSKSLVDLVIQGEQDLSDNYSLRNKDERIHLSTKRQYFY